MSRRELLFIRVLVIVVMESVDSGGRIIGNVNIFYKEDYFVINSGEIL